MKTVCIRKGCFYYFSIFQMNGVTMFGAILLIIFLVVLLIWIHNKNAKEMSVFENIDLPSRFSLRTPLSQREGFVNLASGASVDPNSGAVTGTRLLTDGLLYDENSKQFIENVKKDPYYAQSSNFGATKSNTFDDLTANQLAIQQINDKNAGNVMSREDMKSINKKILSSANNAKYNLFDRAGSQNVKFGVFPSETRAIIDSDYLGWRDRNFSIDTVRRIIPVQGFDMSVDRIPEMMQRQMNPAKVNVNKAPKSGEAALNNTNLAVVSETENTPIVTPGMNEAEVQEAFAARSSCRGGNIVFGNKFQ